jgi:hypothetical protein
MTSGEADKEHKGFDEAPPTRVITDTGWMMQTGKSSAMLPTQEICQI